MRTVATNHADWDDKSSAERARDTDETILPLRDATAERARRDRPLGEMLQRCYDPDGPGTGTISIVLPLLSRTSITTPR